MNEKSIWAQRSLCANLKIIICVILVLSSILGLEGQGSNVGFLEGIVIPAHFEEFGRINLGGVLLKSNIDCNCNSGASQVLLSPKLVFWYEAKLRDLVKQVCKESLQTQFRGV